MRVEKSNILYIIFSVIKKSAKRFIEDRGNLEARSLSYVTLLSIVPLFTVILIELSSLPFYALIKEKLLVGISEYFLPEKSKDIVLYLDTIMEGSGSVGFFGILFSVAMAFLLIITFIRVVNSIWKTKRSDTLLRNFLKFVIIILFVPFLIVITFYFQNYISIQEFILNILRLFSVNSVRFIKFISFVNFRVTKLFSLILNWILLTIVYSFIPHSKVKFFYSFLAGIVSGSIWYFIRLGLNVYVKVIPQMNILYGSLVFIPIFLIWIYVSWVIVLFGVELNYTLHFELN